MNFMTPHAADLKNDDHDYNIFTADNKSKCPGVGCRNREQAMGIAVHMNNASGKDVLVVIRSRETNEIIETIATITK